MQRPRIYLADDEEDIRHLLERFLQESGYEVATFSDGETLLAQFEKEPVDLVILDVMMPGSDGYAVCRSLRAQSDVPIIFLTAREDDVDFVVGFSAGADDYITKPFSPMKLTMRVQAILRRQKMVSKNAETAKLQLDNLQMQPLRRTCTIDGKTLHLTKTEWDLLYQLLERHPEAVSRDALLREVWGYTAAVETRVTDDTVKRLRKKMAETDCCVQIETVWGFGFRLSTKEDA